MSNSDDAYYGIVDLPLNPTTVSIGTLNVPANTRLDTLVFGPNSSAFLSSIEFVVLLDGVPLWEGHSSEVGKRIGIPDEMSYSEQPRLLMIIANPSDLIYDMEFETSTVLVALKGGVGECAITIDVPDVPDVASEDDDVRMAFDADFQALWS